MITPTVLMAYKLPCGATACLRLEKPHAVPNQRKTPARRSVLRIVGLYEGGCKKARLFHLTLGGQVINTGSKASQKARPAYYRTGYLAKDCTPNHFESFYITSVMSSRVKIDST